jgi:ribosome-associated toxin RatA of RatAB toxin-antitoxin module
MPSITRSALVMFNVEQRYQLINDVTAYPQFIPDCGDSKIISQVDNEMTAGLLVSKGGLKKWFTTKYTLLSNSEINMSLVDGPFKYLNGKWQLTSLSEEACKISLHLDYEFSSKVFDLAFGRVFNGIANNMVQAFTQRAKVVYGVKVG